MCVESSNELAPLKHERQLLLSTCLAYVLLEIKLQNLSSERYEFFVQNMNFWMSKYEYLFFKVGRSVRATNSCVKKVVDNVMIREWW